MQATARRPPRPPEPKAAPSGPAWVSAPPPTYHDSKPVAIGELGAGQALPRPPRAPEGPAPVALPDGPQQAVPALGVEEKRPIRCPRCAAVFDWSTRRPTSVTCPACGVTGTIR